MSPSHRARFWALGGIWGSSFLFVDVALEGLRPAQLVLVRLAAGTLVLAIASAIAGQRPPLRRRLFGHLAFLAVVANVAPFSLFAWAQQRVDSGLAAVLNATTPLLTILVALVLLPGERLTRGRAAGALVGFAGVVVIVAPWRQGTGSTSVPGAVACLAAAACYGVAIVWTRRFVTGNPGVSSLGLATAQIGVATLMMAVAAPVVATGAADLEPDVVGAALALGALGTGVAYLLYYRLIADIGATTVATVTYVIPVVAVVLGRIVLDEPLTWNRVLGGAVVIAGVLLVERSAPVVAPVGHVGATSP